MYAILARGDKVIATGRNASSRLQHLASTGAAILDLDVSLETKQIENTVEEALGIYGRIEVLVHNAGYMESCYIEELTYNLFPRSFISSSSPATNHRLISKRKLSTD